MSEFTNRLLLHHEFWKNPSDFGGVKDVDRESLVADLEEAANTIESLQREKEELSRKLEAIDAGHLAKSGGPTMLLLRELDEARAAAITPEMRERIQHVLKYKPYTTLEVAQADLLRELNTGGEG